MYPNTNHFDTTCTLYKNAGALVVNNWKREVDSVTECRHFQALNFDATVKFSVLYLQYFTATMQLDNCRKLCMPPETLDIRVFGQKQF